MDQGQHIIERDLEQVLKQRVVDGIARFGGLERPAPPGAMLGDLHYRLGIHLAE